MNEASHTDVSYSQQGSSDAKASQAGLTQDDEERPHNEQIKDGIQRHPRDTTHKRCGQKDSGVCLSFLHGLTQAPCTSLDTATAPLRNPHTSSIFRRAPSGIREHLHAPKAIRPESGFCELIDAENETYETSSISDSLSANKQVSSGGTVQKINSDNDKRNDILIGEEISQRVDREVRLITQEESESIEVVTASETDIGHAGHSVLRRFFLFILRVTSICLRTPESSLHEGAIENIVFSPDDDYLHQTVPLPYAEKPDDHDNSDPLEMREFIKDVTFDKKGFLLDIFDEMCLEANKKGTDTRCQVVQIANFAAAMLDNRGGCLSIDDLDVHLYVPPGAIPADSAPQKVYIFVQGNSTEGCSFLTPCVHCGPSGFKFSQDVFLTMPHCAAEESGDAFTCVKSTKSGPQKLEDGRDGVVFVRKTSIMVTMDHFCRYAAYGTISAKRVVVCVFVSENKEEGKIFLRVRLMDDIKARIREVEEEERKYGFIRADVISHLEVLRNPAKDVKVILCSVAKSWKITEPKCGWQKIQHSLLWHTSNPEAVPANPCKLFQARSRCLESRTALFVACVNVFQKGRKKQGVDFVVLFQPGATAPLRQHPPINEEQLKDTVRLIISEQLGQPIVDTSVRLIDGEIFKELCDHLDIDHPLGNDWRLLSETLMNEDHRWVSRIETRTQSGCLKSPAGMVLDKFFFQSRNNDKACNLRFLRKSLLNLNRKDLQFAIAAIDGR